jgi:hypothetical protein
MAGGVAHGLRLGESSRPRLGGELVPINTRALLCEFLGYLRTNSGGLHEVLSVSEQIVEPDLQSFDASGALPTGPE